MDSETPPSGSPAPSPGYESPPPTSHLNRKPLPRHVTPVTSALVHLSSPLSIRGDKPAAVPTPPRTSRAPLFPSLVDGDSYILPRNQNRYSRGQHPSKPLRIDTSTSAAYLRSIVDDDDDDDNDEGQDIFDEYYATQFTTLTPLHSRLVSEPFIPVLNSPPPLPKSQRRIKSMALHLPLNRPPLHIDVDGRPMSMGNDSKQPKTPGKKISSFFGWKGNPSTSPGAESSSTDISDGGRSSIPSPMPPMANISIKSPPHDSKGPGFGPPVRTSSMGGISQQEVAWASKIADLESELREISSELAGSIRREMELEDIIELHQSEGLEQPSRRTSDYFSDSGTSSVRMSEPVKTEDIDKIRRTAEQERAQLKAENSQRLQDERIQRTQSESHVQILENQVQQLRRERVDLSDLSSKTRELETALDDTRRKLLEERQSKDNFEDLLTAMRVELEQLRNERDILREGKTPSADMQRLIEEIEALKIENASLAQLQGGRFASIAEEGSGGGASSKRKSVFGLTRSNSLARKPASGLARSGSLSRSNSVTGNKAPQENGESLVDKVKDIEFQRDALHQTVKSLLERQAYQAREFERRTRLMEIELSQAQQAGLPRKLGYERDVMSLREEVNHLRIRAEDALDGKWQAEKGLAGLKMDIDRAEQETSSLRVILQEHDKGMETDQEGFAETMTTSSSLESAYRQLQADRQQAEENVETSDELKASISRTDLLAKDVDQLLRTNSSLRSRVTSAIEKGERDQNVSVERINFLQNRLKELEDSLLTAQQHSEEEMTRHEDEILQLKESNNAQLLRMKNGARSPAALSPRPPNSPFIARSPRLDKTTSGDGVPLAEVVEAEVLEKRVKELEKLLRDADMEMEEVLGRMNRAQVDVAQLQSERDDALRETRRLQSDIQAERGTFAALMSRA